MYDRTLRKFDSRIVNSLARKVVNRDEYKPHDQLEDCSHLADERGRVVSSPKKRPKKRTERQPGLCITPAWRSG